MKRLRRMCLALVLGAGLILPAASASTAAPEAVTTHSTSLASTASPSAAAACPGQGTRVKKASEGRVYVVARDNRLYWIPDETVYFDLWGSWDGIVTLADSAFDACWNTPSYHLRSGHLVRIPDGAIYIWDATVRAINGQLGAYRWIPTWEIFANKYHFDPAAAVPIPTVSQYTDYNWT
ncbi:hypothetical protein QFZ24_009869 [Streptomyces phaeochromogenes]|uniref:hypothetical protein n=1 Tax=Streptomyces phaeochromogenes TaxID=1923 RepID=UPI00278F5819|nr:hypothetical protein [Streptomyces phaeochromogenes]MDQ0955860.1 hypothetical protein [Streptomyces phaeochromogenes]